MKRLDIDITGAMLTIVRYHSVPYILFSPVVLAISKGLTMQKVDEAAQAVWQSNPAELAEFRAATRTLYDLQERAIADGDADLIANAFYAADAVAFGGDGVVFRDRPAWAAIYKSFVEGYSAMRIVSHLPLVRGDAGWDYATMINTAKDGSVTHLAILFLWTRVEGRWICAGNAYAEHSDGPVDFLDGNVG